MSEKEKAKELIERFYIAGWANAVACANICVDVILDGSKVLGAKAVSRRKFWYAVKEEIKTLALKGT